MNEFKESEAIWLQLEMRMNVFANCLLLLTNVLCSFSGVIDIERQNGVKKWICNAKRHSLLTETLDKLLRIYCNAPDLDDEEQKREWITAVAKIYWKSAERAIECKELDDICAEEENEDNDLEVV